MRALRDFGMFFRPENNLREAFPVAQIGEDDAAEIALRMDPAGERDLLADVGGAEGVAMMRAIHGGERRSVSVGRGGCDARGLRAAQFPRSRLEVGGNFLVRHQRLRPGRESFQFHLRPFVAVKKRRFRA